MTFELFIALITMNNNSVMNIWIADSSKRRIKLNKIINKICSQCNVTVFNSPDELLSYPTDICCNVFFVAADTPEFDWVKAVKHVKEHFKVFFF